MNIQVSTMKINISFRHPEEGETPNWLGWYDFKEDDLVLFSGSEKQMDELLAPDNVESLTEKGVGELRKVVYERNGEPVRNVL